MEKQKVRSKRCNIDFSEHEVLVTEQKGLLIHHLKKPGTYCDSVKFINTNGILAVTGDYSNWIFCREFHPSEKGFVSEQYWVEKLGSSSCQEPGHFDKEKTELEIKRLLSEEEDLDEEEKEYLENCLFYVDDELDYTHHAYRDNVGRFEDYENIPFAKSLNVQLLAVFDAFDEICRRMKEEETKS